MKKAIVLVVLLSAVLGLIRGSGFRKSQLDWLPVATVSWHARFPNIRGVPPWIWKTVPPKGCRIGRHEAIQRAIAQYPGQLRVPQTIFVQRTGLKDANPGDGSPACSYVVDFSGSNLGALGHEGPPPSGTSEYVVVVINGRTGRVGNEMIEGW